MFELSNTMLTKTDTIIIIIIISRARESGGVGEGESKMNPKARELEVPSFCSQCCNRTLMNDCPQL